MGIDGAEIKRKRQQREQQPTPPEETPQDRWHNLPEKEKDALKRVGTWILAFIILYALYHWPF